LALDLLADLPLHERFEGRPRVGGKEPEAGVLAHARGFRRTLIGGHDEPLPETDRVGPRTLCDVALETPSESTQSEFA
jgi:hypothetical protein